MPNKILIMIDWYLPGYKAGGPIRSCANLVAHLADEFDFSILTSDRDFGDEIAYSDQELSTWTQAPDGTRICYLKKQDICRAVIHEYLNQEDYDALYLNSFFSYPFTILPLQFHKKHKRDIPVILAPRGMLGQSALAIKSVKKRIYLRMAHLIKLYSNVIWQASSATEAEEIRLIFGKAAKIEVVPNLPAKVDDLPVQKNKKSGRLELAFVGRIEQQKNLDLTLRALNKVSDQHQITLNIIGPIEDRGYWGKCESLIKELPQHINCVRKDPLAPDELRAALNDQEALILPSQHENFSHTIFEAFAAGCLVITSDQTPWQQLERKQIGWDLPLSDETAFANAIEHCAAMETEEFDQRSKKAYTFASEFVTSGEIKSRTQRLLRQE